MAETLGGLRDSDKWSAEVALDVNGESFDRRDIDDAASRFFRRFVGGEHQAVDAPEKSGEGFAGAGGGEDQSGISARDGGPAEDLRTGRAGEDGGEPVADGGMKEVERVRGREFGRRRLWLDG